VSESERLHEIEKRLNELSVRIAALPERVGEIVAEAIKEHLERDHAVEREVILAKAAAQARAETAQAIRNHREACAALRMRNLIILALFTGAGGGGAAVGVVRLIQLLAGG